MGCLQQQYLFNAGWSREHEQQIAAQLQQQVDTVFSGNSQKIKNFGFINHFHRAGSPLSPALNKY
jgi:serine/threonine protein kinase HipA of HipAB toxin-antitoxin module